MGTHEHLILLAGRQRGLWNISPQAKENDGLTLLPKRLAKNTILETPSSIASDAICVLAQFQLTTPRQHRSRRGFPSPTPSLLSPTTRTEQGYGKGGTRGAQTPHSSTAILAPSSMLANTPNFTYHNPRRTFEPPPAGAPAAGEPGSDVGLDPGLHGALVSYASSIGLCTLPLLDPPPAAAAGPPPTLAAISFREGGSCM